jgi:hypothetical protein
MNPARVFPLLFVGAAFCVNAHAATVFNFDSDSAGTATAFTDTVNGLSGTFSSSGDSGGFVIYPSIFDTLTGNVLGNPGPAGLDNLSLSVAFSQNLSAVSFNFATSDFVTPSPLTLSVYENSTLIGSITAPGAFLSGFTFPEGQISFAGAPFNNIVISSAAADFAVDNISVSEVPLPPSLWLFAAGLLALSGPALKRRISPTERE